MEDAWLDTQMRHCTRFLRGSISAVHLTMPRHAFGQIITPKKGSVLASPVMASWNPEPDYFFHWLRDSALVMNAVTLLSRDAHTLEERDDWNMLFEDFVQFSLDISNIKGADYIEPNYESKVIEGCRQYLRPEAEVRSLQGDDLLKEPRFNPDGTPDTHQWSRPQFDGPALRALTCLRHANLAVAQGRSPSQSLNALLLQDLDFTARYADAPGIGPWEMEGEIDHHYYCAVTQAGAMEHGAKWALAHGDRPRNALYQKAAQKLYSCLDMHWDSKNNFYTSARHKIAQDPESHLDISVIMGVLHADLCSQRHSLLDDRVSSTIARLEAMFDRDYPINHQRDANTGVAFGRFKDDKYFSGGAYYFSTFAIAELYYRQAAHTRSSELFRKGDQTMRMARLTIPPDGSLSEQFCKVSGIQNSAQNLTWSHAAFITAYDARTKTRSILAPTPAFDGLRGGPA